MTPSFVVRIQVKDQSNSPYSPLCILFFQLKSADVFMEALNHPIGAIGVRNGEVNRKHSHKAKPWKGYLVLFHDLCDVHVIQPGIGFLSPCSRVTGTKIMIAEVSLLFVS
jgi:hypothetical protein